MPGHGIIEKYLPAFAALVAQAIDATSSGPGWAVRLE
jgi:hypothetical protein